VNSPVCSPEVRRLVKNLFYRLFDLLCHDIASEDFDDNPFLEGTALFSVWWDEQRDSKLWRVRRRYRRTLFFVLTRRNVEAYIMIKSWNVYLNLPERLERLEYPNRLLLGFGLATLPDDPT
jgi:hypothetical protein